MCYAQDDIIEYRRKNSKIMFGFFFLAFLASIYSIFHPLILNMLNIIKDGVPLVSLGLGSLSVSVAIYSWKLAYDSDTKMIQNANVNFLQALSDFEKSRMRYINPVAGRRYSPETLSWRSVTHLERANELDRKMIKKKYHHKLIHYFNESFNALFPARNYDELIPDTQGNLRKMYKIAREYVRRDTEQEDEFNDVLTYIGKEDDESEEEFYHRLFDC